MNYIFNTQDVSQDNFSALEWIDTNGIGGWSSSSITGCNTRRYHGLLVASVKDLQRMVMVSKIDETICINNERYELGANNFGNIFSSQGFHFLQQFKKNLCPEFYFDAGGVQLKKSILCPRGENTTLVCYEVLQAPKAFLLQLQPFIAARDYHLLTHANNAICKQGNFDNNIFEVQAYNGVPHLFIHAPGCAFHPDPDWYYHFNYALEKFRGEEYIEDLFTYGKLKCSMKAGDKLFITLSVNNPANENAEEKWDKEIKRRQQIIANDKTDFIQTLKLAADQFIIRRPDNSDTIIAGYHWFTDWGRDAMISLPGLCLTTGNFDHAKNIIRHFLQYLSEGMIPNRFPDYGKQPEYNTVDAPLWLVLAAYYYYQQTKDIDFISEEIFPAIEAIISAYTNGTRYHIKVSKDGLLYAGEPGVQLTWMDAKIGDWVVTPRTGKAVEVNALWYNVLKIYSYFLQQAKQKKKSGVQEKKAVAMQQKFVAAFWNEEKQCLYDVINDNEKDDSIRPNQLLAISLPFPLISGRQAGKIFKCVTDNLYTPKGLRSLAPQNKNYQAHYGGNQRQRDSAYHQGTVWSYWLGAYIDALMKVKQKTGLKEAKQIIKRFQPHLQEAGIGTVSEIFDGDAPHAPRGCIAQAWSVGELLRVCTAYDIVNAL